MFTKFKGIVLSHVLHPDIKTLFILIFIFGIILLIVYGFYKKLEHIKQAKTEFEVLERRGMIGEAYTSALDEEIVGAERVKKNLRKNPGAKPVQPKEKVELIFPEVHVDKENPIQNDIASYETTLLDLPQADEPSIEMEDADESDSYKTTLL